MVKSLEVTSVKKSKLGRPVVTYHLRGFYTNFQNPPLFKSAKVYFHNFRSKHLINKGFICSWRGTLCKCFSVPKILKEYINLCCLLGNFYITTFL